MALVAGVDHALAQLRRATGYFDDAGELGGGPGQRWKSTPFLTAPSPIMTADPEHVAPVIDIRGRYRDFAVLETTMLGVLSRASRIASNVYELLQAAGGKPVMFFPARFDLPEGAGD